MEWEPGARGTVIGDRYRVAGEVRRRGLLEAVDLDAPSTAAACRVAGVAGTAEEVDAWRSAWEAAQDAAGLPLLRDLVADDEDGAWAVLEPARAERLVSVGLAYARLGRTDAAILTLGRAAERFPEEPVVYTALGRVWLDAAESKKDSVALSKAIGALQPTAGRATASSEALALYGRALYLSGETGGAERTLQEATRRMPVEPLAFRYLAAASDRLGHVAPARDALRRYVALIDPPDAPTLALLADAQRRLGETAAARATVAKALALEPQNESLLRLQRRLGT